MNANLKHKTYNFDRNLRLEFLVFEHKAKRNVR